VTIAADMRAAVTLSTASRALTSSAVLMTAVEIRPTLRGRRAVGAYIRLVGAKRVLAFPRQLAPHRREHGAVEALARFEIRDATVHVIEETAMTDLPRLPIRGAVSSAVGPRGGMGRC
jgi:hypothetical protein